MIEYDDDTHDTYATGYGLRPWESVTPAELAKLERARQCHDIKKLSAMLPNWIKTHQRDMAKPYTGAKLFSASELEFKPGAAPVVSMAGLLTTRRVAKSRIPDNDGTPLAYIAAFLDANQLKA